MNDTIFKDANTFSMFIESTARKNKESLVTTLLQYIESKNLNLDDMEWLKKFISVSLRDKLQVEFKSLGLLKNDVKNFFH